MLESDIRATNTRIDSINTRIDSTNTKIDTLLMFFFKQGLEIHSNIPENKDAA